jgi:beta-galactosidase/beta-glucuronidase
MNKICLLLFTSVFFSISLNSQDAKGQLNTRWASQVDIVQPLNEYPRPQLVRKSWINLNGLWDYSIDPVNATSKGYEGKILVPFPVEASLSKVRKTVGKDSVLVYRRSFALASNLRNQKVLLHFGAVDWQATVFVNGKRVGTHEGGYDPFSFDITSFLKKGQQELVVKVYDPTDEGVQPRGKQVKTPEGIWYTPVTGIWQTVWLEVVPETYIESSRQTTDLDNQTLTVSVATKNLRANDQVRITAWDGQNKIAEQVSSSGSSVLPIANPKAWSPQQPFLYSLKIAIMRNGKMVDEASSYFAMRKISVQPDNNGIQRMLLNNKFQFQFGPLDQGWWPDGLYTAPTDEALKFDVVKTKEMGFNMIRKHVKVEPARWYYYCDSIGMLVWQDMPSGDMKEGRWESRPGVEGLGKEVNRSAESEAIFRKEWNAIIDALYNFPSIVVWVPFNEAWGQFKTADIVNWTMKKDPSRLVNSASGGNFEPVGHIIDLHNYPEPAMPRADLFGKQQVLVLGEFGGLGLPLEGHTWQEKNNWGYQTFKNRQELFSKYQSFVQRLKPLIQRGLSAAVYTQTTDVEVEVNGLMTYDREVLKMPVDSLRQMHQQLYE